MHSLSSHWTLGFYQFGLGAPSRSCCVTHGPSYSGGSKKEPRVPFFLPNTSKIYAFLEQIQALGYGSEIPCNQSRMEEKFINFRWSQVYIFI